jgi:hypothetical protein
VNVTSPARHPAITSVAAAVVAGLALWLSRASFDVAGTANVPLRVAMVPAVSELAGLTVLAMLFAAAIAWLVRESQSASDRPPFWNRNAASILLPLFALGALAIPYLPWIADWLPALRLLAGPVRLLVWVVVVGQVLWLLIPAIGRGPALARHHQSISPFEASVAIAVVSFSVFAWVLSRLGGPETWHWAPLIIAAATAALIWIWSFAVSQSNAAASFAWASVCLTAPFVLNSQELLPGAVLDLFNTVRRLPAASLGGLASGAPGLLFDQEYGLFPYAPVLFLGFVGMALMARDRGRRTVSALVIGGTILLIGLAGSLSPWWSESMMPGRTVLLLLPLLAPPIAWLYARAHGHHVVRAGLQVLLLVSLGTLLAITLNTNQVPLPQEGDGSSSVLVWLSPTWQLWDESPTYVAGVSGAAVIQTALWIVGFGVAGWLLWRTTIAPLGLAALFVTLTSMLAAIAVVSISAALPLDETRRRFDPEARVLFPMLETFNTVVRPIAVKYDPVSVIRPTDLPPLFSLSAVPGQRRSRQPVRVVLNARFRLPAGEYELDVKGSDAAGTVPNVSLALQIGREGRPLETWPLALSPGGVSQHRFRVPIDAEFVGFRASRQVEKVIGELRLRPVMIVEAERRFATPTVRSAADFGTARVFFHDGESYPEAQGMWVKGQTTSRFTILKPAEQQTSLTLAIHGGPRANAAVFATPDWTERVELVPGTTTKVAIPSTAGEAFIPLSVTSSDGFVPAEVESGNKDRRLLGVWIAFIPGDTARTSEGR